MGEIMNENSFKFFHPFTATIAGVTLSGKTELCKKLIQNVDTLINPIPSNIVLSYAEYQPSYESLVTQKNLKLIKGLDFDLNNLDNTLLIIDDQMNDAMKSPLVQSLFIKGVHHKNLSVMLLNQNLYPQGKHGRDIRLNCHYYIIMKSPTLSSQVSYLGRQIFSNNTTFLSDAYKRATAEPYSYLFINLHPLCKDKLRVRSGILPGENEIIYIPK